MPKFTIESQFLVPHYRHTTYEADTLDDAMKMAEVDQDWSGQVACYDGNRLEEITGAWAGDQAHEGENLLGSFPGVAYINEEYIAANQGSWQECSPGWYISDDGRAPDGPFETRELAQAAYDANDDGCPKGDPECLGGNGDCHDACTSFAKREQREAASHSAGV